MSSGPQYPRYPGEDPGEQPGPPPPPPAQPPTYGTQPPAYGSQPYPQAPGPYGTLPTAPGTAPRELAGWWQRVVAYLLDGLLVGIVGVVPLLVGLVVLFADSDVDPVTDELTGVNPVGIPIIVLAVVVWIGFDVWNRILRQGRTGRSLGKSALGLRLVDQRSGEPVGPGAAAARWGVALLIGFVPCGGFIDLLWPLWDEKNQTLHDKTIASVVVRG